MAEQIDLTVPFNPNTSVTSNFKVASLILDLELQQIIITLKGDFNIRKVFTYTGQTAMTLMNALNKANLSVKSLHKRIIEQLISDGKLEGSISGSPD